jgi:hypothetical protein
MTESRNPGKHFERRSFENTQDANAIMPATLWESTPQRYAIFDLLIPR